jgi:hypothetical protein
MRWALVLMTGFFLLVDTKGPLLPTQTNRERYGMGLTYSTSRFKAVRDFLH